MPDQKEMDPSDKLAVAVLAAARCTALGRHELIDYIHQFEEFERAFAEKRGREAQEIGKASLETWKKLAE